MTITVHDPLNGTEINLGPSDVMPGRICVTIFAKAPEYVASAVLDLLKEYEYFDFRQASQCADGKWGSVGYVWNTKSQELADVHEYP